MTEEALKIELIEWRDANFARDGDDWDDVNEDYICATVGWTRDTERWVVIVGEITPGGERAVTRVPKENVITRKRLVVGEDGPLTRGAP
jgi:hypothetical protein